MTFENWEIKMTLNRKLYIEQMDLPVTDRSAVYSEEHVPLYYIDKSAAGLTYTVTDMLGRKILKIKKKIITLLPAFRIVFSDRTNGIIRKCPGFEHTEASGIYNNGDMVVIGDRSGFNFVIKAGSTVLGRIDNERLTWGDVYGIETLDNADGPYLAAVTVIMKAFRDVGNGIS